VTEREREREKIYRREKLNRKQENGKEEERRWVFLRLTGRSLKIFKVRRGVTNLELRL